MSTTLPGTPPEGALRLAAFEKLFHRIGEISSLPAVANRILELAESEKTSMAELLDEIGRDPALCARVLRRVNSAYYGLRTRVSDLHAAINLLGFREVRNLALTVFVARLFHENNGYKSYQRTELWRHCLGVACAARMVSVVSGFGAPGEAYVAGMLHDIGIILIDQHLHSRFRNVLDKLVPELATCALEREQLDFDHTQLGGYVARQWRFPESISDAIAWHHEPEKYHGPHREMVYTIAIADNLCMRAGWTSLGINNSAAIPARIYGHLGLDRSALEAISQELGSTLEKANVLATVG